MNKTLFLSIFLLVVLLPAQAYGQPKKKFITVKKSATEKIIKGLLVGVTDSSLLVQKRSEPYETVTIHANDIYSVRLGKPFGRGLVSGMLIGITIGALYGGMQAAQADLVSTLFTGQQSEDKGKYVLGGMLGGALIGGSLGLLIDLTRMKKPMIIGNQQDAFSAKVGALTYYLVR